MTTNKAADTIKQGKPRGGGFLFHGLWERASVRSPFDVRETKKGVMYLNDQKFEQFFNDLHKYLKQPKVFVTNINRAREFYTAVDIAKRLFPDDKIEIHDDPLQTGAMYFEVETFDIVMRGAREINDFSDMIALADNFEIYSVGKDSICFAAMFQGVNKRV